MAATKKKKPAAKKPAAKKPAKKVSPKKTAKMAKTVAKANASKTPAAVAPAGAAQSKFLADILANPDDKKARLVYADMLQEQGDPRGDFIVVQCTQADLPEGDAQKVALQKSIDEMLKKHKKAWTSFGENKGAKWEYRRGFVEKLSLDADDLLKNAATILANEPIEELNVWKIDESKTKIGKSRLAPILALPLGRVRRLSLARCKLDKSDYEAIGSSKNLGSVELLDLTNGGSYEMKVEGLAGATSMPKLRELKISGCMCGDKQLATLAKSKTLTFSRFVAQRNDVGPAGCEAIANAAWAPNLVHLDLSSNEMLRNEGLEFLATSKHLTKLKSVALTYCSIYERGVDIILASPIFMQLDTLDLTSNLSREDIDRLRPVFGDRLRV